MQLNDKLEAALVALVTAATPQGTSVKPGKNYEDKALPVIICAADGDGDEDPAGTGNYWLEASIMIKNAAIEDEDGTGTQPDPRTTNDTLLDAVAAALDTSNLPATLTAAVDGFYVYPQGVIRGAARAGRDEQGVWIDEFPMKVYCNGSLS